MATMEQYSHTVQINLFRDTTTQQDTTRHNTPRHVSTTWRNIRLDKTTQNDEIKWNKTNTYKITKTTTQGKLVVASLSLCLDLQSTTINKRESFRELARMYLSLHWHSCTLAHTHTNAHMRTRTHIPTRTPAHAQHAFILIINLYVVLQAYFPPH